ncbi:hypothetical protein [Spirulina subsalsa]|nr:hypothetical protein [Spirulina subsalsa]
MTHHVQQLLIINYQFPATIPQVEESGLGYGGLLYFGYYGHNWV